MPEDPDAGRGVEALLAQARHLLDVGRPHEAIPLLGRALVSEPQSCAIRCELSRAFLAAGDGRRSLEEAERAVAADPGEEWPHRLRALALAQVGRKKDAVRAAREAAQLDPDEPRALQTLGKLLLTTGKTAEAEEVGTSLRERAPSWSGSHQLLGLVSMHRKQWGQAETHIRRALEIDPLSTTDLNNLAVVLDRQGKKKEAIERFHDAARLAPTDKLVQRNLKRTVASYVTGGLALVWLAFQALRIMSVDLSKGGPWWILALVAFVAVAAAIVIRVRTGGKLKDLHPTVRAFYEEERRRGRKTLPIQVAFFATFPLALGWTLMIVLSADFRHDAYSMSWPVYGLVVVGAVASTVALVRRMLADRRPV